MKLNEIRTKNNMTQSYLAEKVGITRQAISAIENGKTPSIKTAMKIASIFNFRWEEFFYEVEKDIVNL